MPDDFAAIDALPRPLKIAENAIFSLAAGQFLASILY
jgi:hypothetical protein